VRAKLHPRLKLARIRHPWATDDSDQNGAFEIAAPTGRRPIIIASNDGGWDHISVSVRGTDGTPTWDEMCFVKDLFFEPEEPAYQYHPPHSKYVNVHPGTLHIWRPQHEKMPMPPLVMV